MDTLTYTDARKHLKTVMDRAIRDKTEIAIARTGREAVVIVGKDEWDSIQSTHHLFSYECRAVARLYRPIGFRAWH